MSPKYNRWKRHADIKKQVMAMIELLSNKDYADDDFDLFWPLHIKLQYKYKLNLAKRGKVSK